jgi:aminomethyltransferase
MEETTTELKHTALTAIHSQAGAKMVPFAGYLMPVQYKGLIEEHNCVRNGVGIFDVSHMGEFWLTGKDSEAFLQMVTTNDVSKLYDGKVQYSCMTNGRGGIVDDLLIYRFSASRYLLVVNAGNIDKDWAWLQQHAAHFEVQLEDKSAGTSLFAVQGPKAVDVLQKLTSLDLRSMEYYTFQHGNFAGYDDILISTTGYTGSGGCEIYLPNDAAKDLWIKILEAGEENGIQPIGLGARDTLRLEMGFCLYGNDIDDTTSPLEAGLGWITKFTKDFIDRDYLEKQKAAGLTRKLVPFEMIDKGIPRHDYELTDASGTPIGKVTSGTQSPSLQKAIGLGYVQSNFAKEGSEIYVSVRGKLLKAVVSKLPFYKPS